MTHSEWGLGCRGPEGTDERMDTTPRDTLREETERTTRRHLRGRGTAEARLPANSAWTRGRGERARAAAGGAVDGPRRPLGSSREVWAPHAGRAAEEGSPAPVQGGAGFKCWLHTGQQRSPSSPGCLLTPTPGDTRPSPPRAPPPHGARVGAQAHTRGTHIQARARTHARTLSPPR